MNDQPERMDLCSQNISEENLAHLKRLFPTVFTETQNEKGELVKESIDFEKLKAELGTFSDVFESRREHYGTDWPGKKDGIKLIQQPTIAALKPCREESVKFDQTENLFIEGDNLEVLKLLQKSYYGKIKMIYIDPPYNTGNEFIYPDKFSESLETYLEYAGQEGRWRESKSANSKENPRYHTKWLNMMYPRLYLARNLLREDGVIFISIDDNEANNIRKLCDEIFGEENIFAVIPWQSRTSVQNDTDFSIQHEYIAAYAKIRRKEHRRLKEYNAAIWHSLPSFAAYPLPVDKSRFENPDNDPRGPWKPDPFDAPNVRENLTYPITNPNTKEECLPPTGRHWRTEEEKFKALLKDNRIVFGRTGNSRPQLKVFYEEKNDFGEVPTSWFDGESFGTVTNGTQELQNLFGTSPFPFPKPTSLIKSIVALASRNDELVLDFFAGSCTTAHAVLDLNKEDNGNRKFIMVQLPEPCAEDSEAFRAGYKTIAEIGKERIRRVIKKIKEEQESQHPELFESGKSDLDLGFKVFKLDRSNFTVWRELSPDATEEEIVKRLEEHIFHIDEKASQEDILFELLLKAGFMPTEPVEKKELAGKTLYSVRDGALLICMEEEITQGLIDAVAETEPLQFICLDQGFKGNDQLKTNAVQTFKARNMGKDKEVQIVFRTV